MARAAVKAKQAQAASAQAAAAKSPRKQRGHASGGNPNQDLFFTRLRRKQKWVFLVLAVLFAVSFAALGVGSGGSNLSTMFSGIFGGNGDAVAKAQAEIKTNPAKGWMDLANAYITKNDTADAITALQSYLKIKKSDSQQWALLGSYDKSQADSYVQQYRQYQAIAQQQAPGSIFEPTGALAGKLGTNPIDQYYTQQLSALTSPLYQKATAGYTASLTDYQNAAKYAPKDPAMQQALAQAAQFAGQTDVALKAWHRYLQLDPTSPFVTQVKAECVALGGTSSCVKKPTKPAKK